jgi:hypothetical protein
MFRRAVSAMLMAGSVAAPAAAAQAPAATTGAATAITETTAMLNGTVTPFGTPTTYRFDYGTSAVYGGQTVLADAGTASEPVPAAAAISGLLPATTYHFRVVATNAAGGAEGQDATFTTLANSPPDVRALTVSPSPFVRKPGRGTTIRFELSEAATVRMTFEDRRSGRRVGNLVTVQADAGKRTVRFSGRAGDRLLPTGEYRLTLVATDALGAASAPARAEFIVFTPAVNRAVASCKRAIEASAPVSKRLRVKLDRLCVLAGVRPGRARQVSRRICKEIVRASIPPGSARRQGLRACRAV